MKEKNTDHDCLWYRCFNPTYSGEGFKSTGQALGKLYYDAGFNPTYSGEGFKRLF